MGNCPGEIFSFKRLQIVDAFTDPDSMDWKSKFFCNRNQNTTSGCTVELGHDQARNPCAIPKYFNLAQSVLASRCIKHQHHIVRCA